MKRKSGEANLLRRSFFFIDALIFVVELDNLFYSDYIVSRAAGTGIETRSPGFQLWDLYGAKSIVRNLEAYGSINNLFDNQDPNTGRFAANGITPLAIYRAEIGRSFRVGLRWTFGRDK